MNTHTEEIKCPECNRIQNAEVEHSFPWWSYVHHCLCCEYVIMESEWENTKALSITDAQSAL